MNINIVRFASVVAASISLCAGEAIAAPIALGIMACMGVIDQEALLATCVLGELSLNGAVRSGEFTQK